MRMHTKQLVQRRISRCRKLCQQPLLLACSSQPTTHHTEDTVMFFQLTIIFSGVAKVCRFPVLARSPLGKRCSKRRPHTATTTPARPATMHKIRSGSEHRHQHRQQQQRIISPANKRLLAATAINPHARLHLQSASHDSRTRIGCLYTCNFMLYHYNINCAETLVVVVVVVADHLFYIYGRLIIIILIRKRQNGGTANRSVRLRTMRDRQTWVTWRPKYGSVGIRAKPLFPSHGRRER